MTRRVVDLVKGVTGLAGLLAVLILPPLALVHFVGWPLPVAVPSLEEMATAARSGIDDMVIVKVLAVLAWLCWVQIALAAGVEVAAHVRGRAALRAPVLAGVQLAVGRLVATAALVVAAWGPQRTAAVSVPVARLAALVAEPAPRRAALEPVLLPTPRLAAMTTETDPPVESGRPYVVKRNDSWWAIAEQMLGDGQRWKELRQANVGRAMPDGSTITADSEMIRPGWEVLVPGGSAASQLVPNGRVDEVEVRRGDNLWVMAERHLQEARGGEVSEADVRVHWAAVIEMNRDRLADPANPSRIYAGQQIRMPSVGRDTVTPAAPAPTPVTAPTVVPPSVPVSPPIPVRPDPAPAVTATTGVVPTSAPSPVSTTLPASSARTTSAPAGSVSTDHNGGVPLGALGTASTVLAVGIAAEVTRRRRRRQLRLPARAMPPTPPPELDDLRAAVVVNADVDQMTRLHRALRDIAFALGSQRSDARPQVVQVTTSRIEALLSRAAPSAPKPWRAEASGLSWVLKGDPLDRNDDGIAPNPALVSIGRPDDDTELYLDLEAMGVVSLTGHNAAVADVARSWVLELATSPMANGASVLVIGDAIGDSIAPAEETSDRVRCVETWEEVEADALTWCAQASTMLKANRWATPVVGRMQAERADDLAPLVIVAEGVPSEHLGALADTILDQQAVVVLLAVGEHVDGALLVEVSEELLAIPSLGLACHAQSVPKAVAEQVDDLVADASCLPAQLSLIPEPPRSRQVVAGSAADEYHDPPFEVLLRLLGDISVVGVAKTLKPKQVAVLAYIALNAPVTCERVQDAVWVTPTASRAKRLSNTVSETRAILGAANLPISVEGRYRVGPGVVTDVDLFERRLEFAAQQDDVAAAATLRGALELVRGPVFTYRNVDRMSYVWVDVDNWVSTWELKVTDTAEQLAQRYLDLGDHENAVWAARRGLRACQVHERLTQLLVQAHVAAGDRMAAERVLKSHRAVLEKLDLDDERDDEPDLYSRASQRR